MNSIDINHIARMITENPDEIKNNTMSADQKRAIFEKQIPYIHERYPLGQSGPRYDVRELAKGQEDYLLYTSFLPDDDRGPDFEGETIIWFDSKEDLDSDLNHLYDVMYETHKKIPPNPPYTSGSIDWPSGVDVTYKVRVRLSDNPDKLYDNLNMLPEGHGSGILIITADDVTRDHDFDDYDDYTDYRGNSDREFEQGLKDPRLWRDEWGPY